MAFDLVIRNGTVFLPSGARRVAPDRGISYYPNPATPTVTT